MTVETTPLDGELSDVLHMPHDSVYPLLHALALTVMFYGLLLRRNGLAIGGGAMAAALTIGWLWPTQRERAA